MRRRLATIDWIVAALAVLCVLCLCYYAVTSLYAEDWLARIGQVVAMLFGVGLALMCWQVRRGRLGAKTIRGRLLISFVLIALVPAIAISAGATVVGFYNGRQQALDRLESVAALREIEIGNWTQSLQNELVVALNEEYALDRARVVLDLAQENRYYDYFNKAMRYRLQRFASQSQQIDELFLVDVQGQVVLSTQVAHEGNIATNPSFVEQGLKGAHVQLPFEYRTKDPRAVIAAIPVLNDEDEELGLLAGRASADSLYRILGDQAGLGTTGKTYLVDGNHGLLTDPASSWLESAPPADGPVMHTPGIDAVLENEANGSGVYSDLRDVTVVGVYRWLPQLQSGLLVEQDLSEAFGTIYATLAVNLGIALACVVLAVAASLFITRSISTPLTDLVQTATQIAAGDLRRMAAVEQEDEVGVLARAFNSMTAQLRELISSLEERVQERTQALRRRAVQLETSAKVSRDITSILDIDDLLTRVVQLIGDAFDYYQVHIFLLDEDTQDLIMRASTASGQNSIRRLPAGGTSLNAEAARQGVPVLVGDVEEDGRYVRDECLPEVRSELVVPLLLGERVIGTLDVQSSQVDGFTEDEMLVVESLGDQIAIAIENARLYDRSRELATLEERNRLARELHDSISQSLFSLDLHAKAVAKYLRRDPERAETQLALLRQLAREALEEMRTLIFDLRPPLLDEGGLALALRQQVELLRRPEGPELILRTEGDGRLPPETELGLLRVAQEALTNAMRHANACRIELTVSQDSSQAILSVVDDGCGFDVRHLSEDIRCFGLRGMRERMEALNGSLEIESRLGQGTRVTARVPISGAEDTWNVSAS